jgi:hypothetical protein
MEIRSVSLSLIDEESPRRSVMLEIISRKSATSPRIDIRRAV